MDQPTNLTDLQVEEYKSLLSGMDWWYAMSDDHSVYTEGHARYNKIVALRDRIDQNYEIWNKYAPKEMRK